MASSRRTHKMSLRKAPVDANVTANDGTPQLPTPTRPVVAPHLDPQTASPLFSLPPELRNRIYDHIFAPVDVTLVDGELLPIDLDALKIIPTSDALLRTCRLAKQETQDIFDRSPANFRFWGHNIFVINLDDSRYDEYVRLNEDYDLAELNGTAEDDPALVDFMSNWPYIPDIYLDLGDKQLTAMKRLIVSVKAVNGSCKAHLIERTLPCGTMCWYLDETASIWEGILVSRGHLDEQSFHKVRSIVSLNTKFPVPMVRSFPLRRYVGNNPSKVQYFHNTTLTVQATGGSHYVFMEDREEIHERSQRSRGTLEWDRKEEKAKRKIVKRDQLDIFMEHCWLVFRARENA